MRKDVNYDDFIAHSPWLGRYRFFTKDGKCYRQKVTEANAVIEATIAQEIHPKLYRTAYNLACDPGKGA